MPLYFIRNQHHTLASALREALENNHPNEFVSCTLLHPMDDHLRVEAPSEQAIREALLDVKRKVQKALSVMMVS